MSKKKTASRFDKGFAKGSDKGSAKGSDKGSATGFDKGFAKGSDKGSAKGSDKGSDTGFDKGFGKGSDKGSAKGLPKESFLLTVPENTKYDDDGKSHHFDSSSDESKSPRSSSSKEKKLAKSNQDLLWKASFRNTRSNATGMLFFIVLTQLLIITFLFLEVFNDPFSRGAHIERPRDLQVVLTRFICAIFLHLTIVDGLSESFRMMKFAMNHHWRFKNWVAAFFVGFLEMVVLFLVESINIVILLQNNTILDIIMNFLAILIISEFGSYFFNTVKKDPVAQLIENGKFKL